MQNNENAYERYRRVHKVSHSCAKQRTSYFIERHESKVTIHLPRTDEDIAAVVVMTDSEGPDNALLFVYSEADVVAGDFFSWNEGEHNFLVTERVTIIKDVDYKKFNTVECNIQLDDGR